jgi:hypothetical protein
MGAARNHDLEVQFDDRDALMRWYDSKEYEPLKQMRLESNLGDMDRCRRGPEARSAREGIHKHLLSRRHTPLPGQKLRTRYARIPRTVPSAN